MAERLSAGSIFSPALTFLYRSKNWFASSCHRIAHGTASAPKRTNDPTHFARPGRKLEQVLGATWSKDGLEQARSARARPCRAGRPPGRRS
eukprot:1383346-Rhodomonas_salina.6